MNRLHKKCIFASAGLHGLLGLIVLFGAAFFVKETKIPEVQPISFVPSKLVDDLLSNAGGAAPEPVQPQPPAPVPVPQPAPPVTAPPPEPTPTPVKPQTEPPPKPAPIPIEKPKVTPPVPVVAKKEEPKPAPPKKVIKPTFSSEPQSNAAAEARRREQEKAEADRVAKLNQIQQKLRTGLSSKLDFQSLGAGGEAYANYGQEIMRRYEQAWRPPAEVASDSAIVTVQVKVARNGKVLADPITSRSGHGVVDRSVQEALDRVRAAGLPPFPASAKDSERTFIIKFNLQSKRSE